MLGLSFTGVIIVILFMLLYNLIVCACVILIINFEHMIYKKDYSLDMHPHNNNAIIFSSIIFHYTWKIIDEYSCARILQAELNSFIVHWNGHRIRTSRNADDLHDMPEMFGISSFYKNSLLSLLMFTYFVILFKKCF